MQFQHNISRRTTDIQAHDGNHRQKNTEQKAERKKYWNWKKIELLEQNTYEKKNKKNTIPEALLSTKEKHKKEEPIQQMEKFGVRPKTWATVNRPCSFCGAPIWTQLHKCPAIETN